MIRLLLFDIDGTLVLTGGAGRRAMALAARDLFHVDHELESTAVAGRTDAWIVAQMAATYGVSYSDRLLARFREIYVSYLEREIHQPGPQKGVLPGIPSILDTLARRSDTHVALLTGNFERGAQIKLEYFNLWRFFSGGAFGDSAHDRNSLLSVALDGLKARGGPVVDPSEVLIIGDTPLDVAVAMAGGARSLAVATGSHDVDTLKASGADVVMKDLSDLNAALEGMGLTAGPG